MTMPLSDFIPFPRGLGGKLRRMFRLIFRFGKKPKGTSPKAQGGSAGATEAGQQVRAGVAPPAEQPLPATMRQESPVASEHVLEQPEDVLKRVERILQRAESLLDRVEKQLSERNEWERKLSELREPLGKFLFGLADLLEDWARAVYPGEPECDRTVERRGVDIRRDVKSALLEALGGDPQQAPEWVRKLGPKVIGLAEGGVFKENPNGGFWLLEGDGEAWVVPILDREIWYDSVTGTPYLFEVEGHGADSRSRRFPKFTVVKPAWVSRYGNYWEVKEKGKLKVSGS